MKNMFSRMNKSKIKITIIACNIILFVVAGLSIGFSAFNIELGIRNILATVKVKADIRVIGVSQKDSSEGAYSISLNYNKTNINGTAILPNADSYIDYDINIANIGNLEMGIKNIISENENLDYELLNYNLKEKICVETEEGTSCNLGIEKTITLRVKWKDGMYNSNNTSSLFLFNLDFENYHKITVEDSIKDLIINCPSEVINTDNLEFTYIGKKFDVRVFMNGQIYPYKKEGQKIIIENVTGPVLIKYISYDIENGSFEVPELKKDYQYTESYLVDAWETTDTKKQIELAAIYNNTSPHLDLTSSSLVASTLPDGNQFAEINANEKSTLFQYLTVESGTTYKWNLYHRGRSGQELMALVIGTKQENEPKKVNKTSDDQFNVMVEWLLENNPMDLKFPTKKMKYTIYSPKFDANGGFIDNPTELFSYTYNDVHTEKWEIWLISSSNSKWFEYKDIYVPTSNDIIFALCSVVSSKTSDLSFGNLIDYIKFEIADTNLIVNGSFEDIVIDKAYNFFNALNSTSPADGIGWSSTSTDRKVEVGNFEKSKHNYGISTDYTNVNAYVKDGLNFIELNAEETGTIFQNFLTKKDKTSKWSITHRGRGGIDYMILLIGGAQDHNPSKASSTSNDQFMKIVDWIKSNLNLVDYGLDYLNEETGCTNKIELYTARFSTLGNFEVDDSEAISLTKDEIHTEKWSIWIIGSDSDDWHTYGIYDNEKNYDNTYTNTTEIEETTIAMTNFDTYGMRTGDSKGRTTGNLVDYILWEQN